LIIPLAGAKPPAACPTQPNSVSRDAPTDQIVADDIPAQNAAPITLADALNAFLLMPFQRRLKA
jgi:hypothetical protein